MVNTPRNPWFVRPRPNPRATLRLFCFPYAGGGASVFRKWPEYLPSSVEVCAIQLPGREGRLAEEAFKSLPPLIEVLGPILISSLDRPFVFFGHSLGASIGFELTRWLRRYYQMMPAILFVAGRRAPHLPDTDPAIHDLPDKEFLEELRTLKGTAPEVLANPELMQLVRPMLSADFAMSHNYEYVPGSPLECPIVAFGGLEDEDVTKDYLDAWREHTSASFTLRMLPGDHFFLHASQQTMLHMLAKDLLPLTSSKLNYYAKNATQI
jgi:medium-chain acyl-[acyl-carrier-protein] hydrolase